MAVLTAHYWRLLPHVIWHYPFRYYVELRNAYIAANTPLPKKAIDIEGDPITEFNAELFRGDAV